MKINRSLAAAAALVAAGSAALVAAPEVNAQLMVRGRVLNIVPHERSSPLSLGVANAGAFVSSLKIDPVIFGVGLGYKF